MVRDLQGSGRGKKIIIGAVIVIVIVVLIILFLNKKSADNTGNNGSGSGSGINSFLNIFGLGKHNTGTGDTSNGTSGDTSGNTSGTTGGKDTVAPSAPGLLNASSPKGSSSVVLSWNRSNDAGTGVNGYAVYQNGTYKKSTNDNKLTLDGVPQGSVQSFTVTAVDNAGNQSIGSNLVTVRVGSGSTNVTGNGASGATSGGTSGNTSGNTSGSTSSDTTPPGAPGQLHGSSSSGSTSVTLSWSPSTDSSSGINSYAIYQNGSYVTSVTGTSATIAGLPAGSVQGFSVYAIDNAGNQSSGSNNVIITVGGGSGALGNTGGGSAGATATGTSGNTGLGTSGFTSGATSGNTAGGTSSDSTPPTTPGNLSGSSTSGTSVTLSWSPSTDSGSGINSYAIYQNGSYVTSVTGTSAIINGLPTGVIQSFTVVAIDNAGNQSGSSNQIFIAPGTGPITQGTSGNTGLGTSGFTSGNTAGGTSGDTTPPSAPVQLYGTSASGSTSVTLHWTASTDSGSGINSYSIYQNGTFIMTVTGTSGTITGLPAGSVQTYTVYALDNAGNQSGPSNGIIITVGSGTGSSNTTAGGTATGTTGLGTSGQTSGNTATGTSGVTSGNTAGNTSGATATSGITSGNTATGTTGLGTSGITTNGTAGATSGITSGNTSLGTSGVTTNGTAGATSGITTGTTAGTATSGFTAGSTAGATGGDTIPPSAPKNLKVLILSTGAAGGLGSTPQTPVKLTWNASQDNNGGSGLNSYNIFRNGTNVGSTFNTSAVVNIPGTTGIHTFVVRAVDNAGNQSGQSNSVTINLNAIGGTTTTGLGTSGFTSGGPIGGSASGTTGTGGSSGATNGSTSGNTSNGTSGGGPNITPLGGGTVQPNIILLTQKEGDLYAGIINDIKKMPVALWALDVCLPGPDIGYENRLKESLNRELQRLLKKTQKKNDDKAEKAIRAINQAQAHASDFVYRLKEKMLADSTPSIFITIYDEIAKLNKRSTDLKTYYDQYLDKRTTLARLQALKADLEYYKANPTATDAKSPTEIITRYLAIQGSVSTDNSITERTIELETLNEELANLGYHGVDAAGHPINSTGLLQQCLTTRDSTLAGKSSGSTNHTGDGSFGFTLFQNYEDDSYNYNDPTQVPQGHVYSSYNSGTDENFSGHIDDKDWLLKRYDKVVSGVPHAFCPSSIFKFNALSYEQKRYVFSKTYAIYYGYAADGGNAQANCKDLQDSIDDVDNLDSTDIAGSYNEDFPVEVWNYCQIPMAGSKLIESNVYNSIDIRISCNDFYQSDISDYVLDKNQ